MRYENILELKNVSKKYKDFELKNISFTLPKGYIMGLIGPNGSGKTSIIRLIMNLYKKDSGSIKVFNLDNIENGLTIKDRIGFVYDENYFYEEYSVNQIKNIIAPLYKAWDESVYKKYLNDFEIDPKKKIKKLSKGTKMKASLALALSHNADFIIMDEPTAGLDPVFRREILNILYDIIQDENKGILFSTHITSDLDKIADYITFVNNGEIVFSKPKDETLEEFVLLKGKNELIDKEIPMEFIGINKTPIGFEALSKNTERIRNEFKQFAVIEKPTLEDIMFYYVRGLKNNETANL